MKKYLIVILVLFFSFSSFSEECSSVSLSSDSSKYLGLGAVSGVVIGVGGTVALQKFIKKVENLINHYSDFEDKVKDLKICTVTIDKEEWDTVSESDTVVECRKPFDKTSIYFKEWNKNTLLKNIFSEDYLIVENHKLIFSINGLLEELKDLRDE